MESPSSKQLAAPLLSGENEFLEYEKEEELVLGGGGEEQDAGSSALMNPTTTTDEEIEGGSRPLEFRRRRTSPRRNNGGGDGDVDSDSPSSSSLHDPLLASGEDPEGANHHCEIRQPSAEEQEAPPRAVSAPSSSWCCRRGTNFNAAVTASLVLLWVLAASFVTYQSSLRKGRDGSPSSRNGDDEKKSFPPLRLATELATLSWLVYRFRDVDDPATVCPIIHANYSHILDGASDPDVRRLRRSNNNSSSSDHGEDNDALECHWYFHDRTEGTQVLLVSTPNYLAVVFSGTDDVQTSLTDVNLFTAEPSFFNLTAGYDRRIRIHAGFHQAVFAGGVLSNVTRQLKSAMDSNDKKRRGRIPWYRRWRNRRQGPVKLYTTGHSLGGANAILTALALQATAQRQNALGDASPNNSNETGWVDGLEIQSISFGCPRIGNLYWRDFANTLSASRSSSSSSSSSNPIIRVVLGWDLVPRLPEFLLHVGHTFQLSKAHQWIGDGTGLPEEASTEVDEEAVAVAYSPPVWNTSVYYQHYGDPEHGYAGVPLGWSATPFLWVPGALSSHSIRRYVSTLANMTEALWATDFARTPSPTPGPGPVDPKNATPANNVSVDDDFYAEPPEFHEAQSALSASEMLPAKAEFDEMSSRDGDDTI
jgi:Lipase (class 3)